MDRRVVSSLDTSETHAFICVQPTPATLRADGVAVATHLITEGGVDSLIIHGESIGGVAATGTARYLSQSSSTKDKISLLICDRTFSNLEAVSQRLVGTFHTILRDAYLDGALPFLS